MEPLNLKVFTEVLSIVKGAHWMAEKHSQHKILDDLYGELSTSFDEFVEAFIGKYHGDVEFSSVGVTEENLIGEEEDLSSMSFRMSPVTIISDVERTAAGFCDYLEPYSEEDSGLASIFDDIKNSLHKALYLLRMD